MPVLPRGFEKQWCLSPSLGSGWPELGCAAGSSWQKECSELGGNRNKMVPKFLYRCGICLTLADHRDFRWYSHCFFTLVWPSDLKYTTYITSLGGGSEGNRWEDISDIKKKLYNFSVERLKFNWIEINDYVCFQMPCKGLDSKMFEIYFLPLQHYWWNGR